MDAEDVRYFVGIGYVETGASGSSLRSHLIAIDPDVSDEESPDLIYLKLPFLDVFTSPRKRLVFLVNGGPKP